MRRALLLVVLGFFVACSSRDAPLGPDTGAPIDGEVPWISGVIASRRPAGSDGSPAARLLVAGPPRASLPACAASAYINYDQATTVMHRSGEPADAAALIAGRSVSVWITGIILDSCPSQAAATRIVIEDTPSWP